jgi:N-acyl-phosphatidylethanolamine-hydrolysing phospholipase D
MASGRNRGGRFAIGMAAPVLAVVALAGPGPILGTELTPIAVRPPHHTSGGFQNPGLPWRAPPLAVAVPFFVRRLVTSAIPGLRTGAPERVANDGVFLRSNALGSVPTVTWVGHSTLLVQLGHVSFLTDPIWSATASPLGLGPRRFVEPGLSIVDLPRIDFVVVSHNHYDHMDIPTLKMLADRGTRFFVPLSNASTLEQEGIGPVEELDWWEQRRVGGVSVYCVPARHWSRRGLLDENRALWSGWVVVADDRRFYFAGDTGSFAGFREIGDRLGPFDLAAMPIGAYSPAAMMEPSHLNPEQAVAAAIALQARHTVGVHFGTFDLSDEPLDEPSRRYIAASVAAGRGANFDWILPIGGTRLW